MKLVFSGPVKNCDSNLEKNLNFLINLKNDSRIELVDIFILEGDSIDNSKINLDNTEDINKVTHYQGKPFYGIGLLLIKMEKLLRAHIYQMFHGFLIECCILVK